MITEAMIQAIIAENERLKAVIDEANSQEYEDKQCAHERTSETQTGDGTPVYFCHDCGMNSIEEFTSESAQQSFVSDPHIIIPGYDEEEARRNSVEAWLKQTRAQQQACAECGDNDPCLALYCVRCIELMKKSPAVAVPDSPAVEHAWERFQAAINNNKTEDSRTQFHSWADEKGFCMDEVWSSVGEPFESEDTQLAWEIWQASRDLLPAPSPRITEQDARAFFESIFSDSDTDFEVWMGELGGRALLEKLNKPESVGG